MAVADRATICALHLGIAEGLVTDTGTHVGELIAYDPRRAGCRLRLQATPPPGHRLSLRGREPRP